MEQVRIGGFDYDIVMVERLQDDKGERLAGEIDSMACVIKLDNGLCPQMQRQSLWHEILHELLTQAGQPQMEEGVVEALAFGIMSVLRDNPILAQMPSGNAANYTLMQFTISGGDSTGGSSWQNE